MSSMLLAEVGWDGGFALPMANAENNALKDEIQRKEKERTQLEYKVGECKDRIKAMTEHLKNVHQELAHTQALRVARERETDSEKHLKAVAERETGRLGQEIKRLQTELGALREKKNTQENDIFKANQKLEDLRNRLNWDQQTLDDWLEESARQDDDSMAIAKYAQQDESRIKSLTVAIEKKTIEANKMHKTLDNAVTETMLAQISLDKTAENFRQAHVERQQLIHQWENTIAQMRTRDAEMQQCSLQLAEVNQLIREKSTTVKEKKVFLENEVENNKEHERKISAANQQAHKLRLEHQELEKNRARLKDELESLKHMVDRTATDVESVRSQISSQKRTIQDKTNKLEEAQLRRAALEQKLQTVQQTVLTTEERAAQMEQMLRDEEEAMKELDVQLQRQREALFREKQDLAALRTKEKDSVALLTGSRATLSGLDSQLNKLDHNLLKQQEIMYNQDFQIQQLERKLARLQGEVSTEEKEALEKKTNELSHALDQKKKTHKVLKAELKQLEDDILCMRKAAEKTAAEKRDLTTKMEELQLFNDTTDKELKRIRLKKQDSMVEEKVLRLQVQRQRAQLYERADGVLSQEKRRLRMQEAMRERQEEIRELREVLSTHIKVHDQERQGISAEVHERLSKIDMMKKRYEILTFSMAAPEGEEEMSQAYYVIKAAQEREELKRKGDSLDEEIRKMEKEITAFENTLQLINSCNASYRKALTKVPESSEEYQKKLKLEEQERAAEEKLKYKKRQIKEVQEDIQELHSTLEHVEQEEVGVLSEQVDQRRSHIVQLNKELASQRDKLNRVTKQCSRLTKELRSANKSREETFVEKDIRLREMRDFNKTLNRMLLDAMEDNPHLRTQLEKFFLQANLTLPSPPSSTASSRLSSKTSSPRSSASPRSSRSSASSSSSPTASTVRTPASRASTVRTPTTSRAVDLGLGLSVTSPPLTTLPHPSRASSSSSSSSSSRRTQR